jgi:hypothetical protein
MYVHQAKSKNNVNSFLINGKGSIRLFSRNNGIQSYNDFILWL